MTARNPKEPSGRGRQGEAAPGGHVPPPGVAFVGHTPTPWSIAGHDGERTGINGPSGFSYELGPIHGQLEVWGAADARLIVRAVNAHAALVEALSRMVSSAFCDDACATNDEEEDPLTVQCDCGVGKAKARAIAALQLARGES